MAQKHNVSCIEHPMTVATTEQGPQKRYRRLRFPSFDSVVWSEKNPLLQKGELGHEKDTGRFKVGDGVTYWEDLPYNSVGDKGDKGDNAIINGYNIINIVEGRNISVEQEGDTLIISAKGEASGSYNKEEIDNKFAVVNSSIDANADAIQKTRNDYIEADSEIHQILNSHAGELTTLKNNQDELGDQVSGIEEKIPETASGTNHLITKQQLSDAEMDIREEISAVDSSAVHKTANETIDGIKTFLSTIGTGAGTGIAIAGTDYSYTMRSAGATPNGCGLFLNNNASHPAFLATDTKITVGGGNIVPFAVTPPSTDDSTRIATTAWVNNATVHKTGDETIGGIKTFQSPPISGNNGYKTITSYAKGSTPSSTQYFWSIVTYDKNGSAQANKLSQDYVQVNTDGTIKRVISVFKNTSGDATAEGIEIGFNANGQVFTKAPTPASTSNGTDIATTAWVNSKISADLPAGVVVPFGGTSVPSGWLKCDGSAVSRTTYAKLFAAIGTRYGTGNGSTTFNLPTQSVLPLGLNADVSVLGTGKTLGLTNGTNNVGMGTYSTEIYFYDNAYNINITNSFTGSTSRNGAFGVTTDSSKSGLKGTVNLANATGAKAIVCIKY